MTMMTMFVKKFRILTKRGLRALSVAVHDIFYREPLESYQISLVVNCGQWKTFNSDVYIMIWNDVPSNILDTIGASFVQKMEIEE